MKNQNIINAIEGTAPAKGSSFFVIFYNSKVNIKSLLFDFDKKTKEKESK